MKTQILSTIMIISAMTLPASANNFNHSCIGISGQNNTYYGPAKCSGVDLPELTIEGYLKLTDHSIIHGALTTNGVLEITDSAVNE